MCVCVCVVCVRVHLCVWCVCICVCVCVYKNMCKCVNKVFVHIVCVLFRMHTYSVQKLHWWEVGVIQLHTGHCTHSHSLENPDIL